MGSCESEKDIDGGRVTEAAVHVDDTADRGDDAGDEVGEVDGDVTLGRSSDDDRTLVVSLLASLLAV